MPNPAVHLDVGVTSIYWYFRNKEDLLRQMSARFHEKVQAKASRPSEYDPSSWRQFLSDSASFQRTRSAEDDLVVDLVYLRTSSYIDNTGDVAFDFALAHVLDQAEVLLEKERAARSK